MRLAVCLAITGSGLRHPAMLLGKEPGGRNMGRRHLRLGLPTGDDLLVPIQCSLEPDLGNVRGIILLGLTHCGVEHVSPFEEIGLGRTRHQAGDSYLRTT